MDSVGRGDDISGISDINTEIIIKREVTNEDEAWTKEIRKEFEPIYPSVYRIDLDILSESELNSPQAERLKFIFKTDSVFISGVDITKYFSYLPPRKKLAKLLNNSYRNNIQEIQQYILEPDEEDKKNPNHVAECVLWIAKKALRLSLEIVMIDKPFYARRVDEMAENFSICYPDFQVQIRQT